MCKYPIFYVLHVAEGGKKIKINTLRIYNNLWIFKCIKHLCFIIVFNSYEKHYFF